MAEVLSDDFIDLTPDGLHAFRVEGTLQMLDDCGKNLTFTRANIYSGERVVMGKDRIMHHVVLPHHLIQSSRGYSWYQHRLNAEQEE